MVVIDARRGADVEPRAGADGVPVPGKPEVVARLGMQALLLPALVSAGLEANDRAKYLLSLLQQARAHADAPNIAADSLRAERLAANVGDAALDTVVAGSRRVGTEHYALPCSDILLAELRRAAEQMLEPLDAAGTAGDLGSRLASLLGAFPDPHDGVLAGSFITDLAGADRTRGDSLHLFVMDAHRALNRLQQQIAVETVDGALVYHLDQADRPLVAAFMAGVRRTAALKFDHPGLGTTATRSGTRVLIQNDIGETDAHVIVISVEVAAVTVSYTDVHRLRLRWFEESLAGFPVQWSGASSDPGSASIGSYRMVIGRYSAPDRDALLQFLEHLGSRLVFLIDWNRARKRLAPLIGRRQAVRMLDWAANNELGHIGFLQLGGDAVIHDAVTLATGSVARYGQTLSDAIGHDAATAIVRFAITAASEGLRGGKSRQLVRDEVRVEVLRHVRAARSNLLSDAARHAGLIVETAHVLHAAVIENAGRAAGPFVERAAARAAVWEHQADTVLREIRSCVGRVDGAAAIAALVTSSDDAIDDLEEAIFLMTLQPGAVAAARGEFEQLAGVAVAAAKEHCKAMAIAAELAETDDPDDLEDFLVAVDRVAALEHQADQIDRVTRAALIARADDFRTLHVADLMSGRIENATDALSRTALQLRDQVLARTKRV